MRLLSFLVALLAGSALAQQTPPAPSFEVATVKPAAPNQPGNGINFNHNQVMLNNVTLRQAILYAYQLREYQLSGGPKWATSETFDIVGKAEASTKPDALRPMLQALLGERFQLTLRKETKPIPAYALIVARGGIKAEKAARDDVNGSSAGAAMLNIRATSLKGFADILASKVGRLVVDRTATDGLFNCKLHFAPDNAPPDTAEPNFFTALQEQCGLKLEPTTAPGDTFVIDRAERPSAN
jgi:uncharacterized protein (TIGR03435 family)